MANIIDDLNWRGLIKDYSDENKMKELLDTPQTIYCGFDPSAGSLHIGNFVMISILMRLQQAGHRIIAVVGGATGMIGDPSGKSKERNLLDKDTAKKNTESIRNQLSKFLDLEDPKKGILINNYDWLSKISLLDYLRDYAKYFNVNYMINKDIVKSRLEAGISLAEFSYMTLQSIDFLHLHQSEKCNIQIGGSDQWGNLTAGLELIRKLEPEARCEIMTANLITRSDGKKFGKSEDGALFLDSKLTSPYKLYQFFINQSDEDSVKYLKVFTFLSKEEITEIEKEHLANLGQRIAQKRLAYEVTKEIHGEEKANEAIAMSECLFKNDFSSLKEDQVEELFPKNMIINMDKELPLADLLVETKAAQSKREAREFIKNGAILINGNQEKDENKVFGAKNGLFNKYLILRRGKKNYYLIKY
ncbi:MAG: tyrosine--tRNA ligase [Bacilli bacterium]|jgi:tyrosyl-tRNA synthetase